MDFIERIKPRASKNWLQLIAGLIWTGVGFYLISLAWDWIFAPRVTSPWIYLVFGLIIASLIYYFGFSILARKNSQRIDQYSVDKPCLFAFQEWHSYPLVIVMIAMGIGLRKYSQIPKPLLGILYLGIGGGLGMASLHYYRTILIKLAGKSE